MVRNLRATCVHVPSVQIENPFSAYVETLKTHSESKDQRTSLQQVLAAQLLHFHVRNAATNTRTGRQFYLPQQGVFNVSFAPDLEQIRRGIPYVLRQLDVEGFKALTFDAAALEGLLISKFVGDVTNSERPPIRKETKLYQHPAAPRDKQLRLWETPRGELYTVRGGNYVLPFPEAIRVARASLTRAEDEGSIAHYLSTFKAFATVQ